MKTSHRAKSDITSTSNIAAESSKPQRVEHGAVGAPPVPRMTPEDRFKAVAECAYYLAEARGFQPGTELEDWLAAEAQIDKQFQ